MSQPRMSASEASASCREPSRKGMKPDVAGAKTLLDHPCEEARDLRALLIVERRAGSLAHLPEMIEELLKAVGVALAGGRVGEDRQRPRQRLEVNLVGPRIMLVKRRPPDIGAFDDVADLDLLRALAATMRAAFSCRIGRKLLTKRNALNSAMISIANL